MACPDRDNDLRILEEVALRNARKQQKAAAREETPGSTFEHHWEGSLLDIQYSGIPLDRVESIRRTEIGKYMAVVRQGD